MTSTESPKFGCVHCGGQESRVIETRTLRRVEGLRRRRVCIGCGARFTTVEVVQGHPKADLDLKGRLVDAERGRSRMGRREMGATK